ncbi:MAG: hypothetical protein PHF97_12650 [Bacteroidales bacterium]|nr:hypothetical protein [Bacteroidales bacterium]MDD4604635.1 hypothetical protein [Bacteroidales bacterium]
MKKTLLILLLTISCSVLFAQTKTELKNSDLQKPITEYLNKNCSGFTFEKAFKIDSKGVITYDVCMVKNKNYEKFMFDKDGQFLRKEPCAGDCCKDLSKKQ